MKIQSVGVLTLFLFLVSGSAVADGNLEMELDALRMLVNELRSDYETRIEALEQRLATAESRALQAEQIAETAQLLAEDIAYAPQSSAATSPNTFNPAIGAVLIGTYADVGLSEATIPGFQLAGEPGPGDGLSLGESEINFKANIDDKFFGNLTFALADEDGEVAVELEEAWIQTTRLPVQLTAGRFFSGVGYLNGFHLHADDFVDRPLPYQAFLAGQYLDDGIQARWLAPTPMFLEFGAEIMRGDKYPAGPETDGQETFSAFIKTGGDIGLSHSWKAGFSYLDAKATGRSAGHHGSEETHAGDDPEGDDSVEGLFGDSELYALEFVYKWAPEGNSRNRNFKLQGEYFWRDEQGLFDGLAYQGDQDGWYLQGAYQFRPGWRIGYRHDQLHADNRGVEGTELDDLNFDPKRDSIILEWSNSEFSRLRVQYTQDRSTLSDDEQVLLQYIMSLGAHGAHQF